MARVATSDPLEKFRFTVYELDTAASNEQSITNLAGETVTTSTAPTTANLAGFTTAQLPKTTTSKITYREGDNLNNLSSLSPGLSSTEDIVLTKGIISRLSATGEETGDHSWFYIWASSITIHGATDSDFNFKDGTKTSSVPDLTRKDLLMLMKDRTGRTARAWKIYNAFPVQFTPGSDLDASADDSKSVESLTLAYESFEEVSIASYSEY